MTVGTDLLVKVFEVFTIHNTSQRVFRRLFCESGQAGVKSYQYVNQSTKIQLGKIIPKCIDCKHSKIQTRSIVMTFEDLAKINQLELLKELYNQIGGPSRKAYLLCNQTTQSAIQKLGLQELYVKGKSLHTKI